MISKELLSIVLDIPLLHIRYNDTTNLYKIFKEDLFNWSAGSYGRWSNLEVNIYELAHKNLKEWAKLKSVFDIIDWSEEPEQIFKKAEELRNEIN